MDTSLPSGSDENTFQVRKYRHSIYNNFLHLSLLVKAALYSQQFHFRKALFKLLHEPIHSPASCAVGKISGNHQHFPRIIIPISPAAVCPLFLLSRPTKQKRLVPTISVLKVITGIFLSSVNWFSLILTLSQSTGIIASPSIPAASGIFSHTYFNYSFPSQLW